MKRLACLVLNWDTECNFVLQKVDMMKLLPYLVLGYIRLLQLTCRARILHDSRPGLKAQGNTWIYACLHAQQIASMLFADPNIGAMVSRSKDGDLIATALRKLGVTPIRGSGGESRKGGAAALRALVQHVSSGKPAFLAVDGPKGPRGVVHPGAAMLSIKTQQPIVPLSMIPRRRVIFSKTWDRFQLPLPFCRVEATFGEPIFPKPGESVREFRDRVQESLLRLQRESDPAEAAEFQAESTDETPLKNAA